MTSPESTNAEAKRPRSGSRIRRALAWTVAAVVVIAVGIAGFGAWTVVRAFPQANGEIELSGLDADVVVQRDRQGIPTITAETSADLFKAQGFVHAQDRFWKMDFRRHLTSARLSELFGESQVGTDSFLRTLGWHRIAEEEVEALSDEARSYYEAYADGVNAYLSERSGGGLSLEYSVLGIQNRDYAPEPWTAADSAAWLKAMAWDLRTNIEDETTRALLSRSLGSEQLNDLYPAYPFDEHPVILAEDPSGSDIASLSAQHPVVPAGSEGPETSAEAEAETSAEAEAEAEAETDPGAPASSAASASATSAAELAPLAETVARVDALISAQVEGVGSNAWIVSGEHTATGAPLLANDPHLGAAMPSVWTQMQLRCERVTEECPFDVAGFSFSGLPGIVIGHNQRVAWGFTNLTTDVADLYVERVEEDGYWQDGEKHPFEQRTETISVAGGEDVELEVRSTKHGPIVSDLTDDFAAVAADPRVGTGTGAEETAADPSADGDLPPGENAISLQWTALTAGTTPEAIFTLNRAENFSDFRLAASQFDVPAQNLMYADVEGNIGYQAPGKLPIRGEGDGWLPQPGWDSAYDWKGYIPFEEQPVIYNPESGYIVTANNAIVDDEYPHFLSRDWDSGYRAARIVELLEDRIRSGPVTAADLAEIQMDNRSPVAASLQRAYADFDSGDQHVQRALHLLLDWNGQNDADSAAAAFANVLWDEVSEELVGGAAADVPRDDQSRLALVFDRLLDEPESAWWSRGADRDAASQEQLLGRAAQHALDRIVRLQGSDPSGWNWGELHAITLTSGTFGESGIAPIEALFNRGPYPVGGGSGVVNATGWELGEGFATTSVPSMRMVIDLADWDASTWHHLSGASGHAFHPNYADQTPGWAAGEQYRWAYSPEAVSESTTDELLLRPTG